MQPNLRKTKPEGYKEAKANGLIESGILTLTDALYASKCLPISSCEGHGHKLSLFDFIKYYQKPSFKPFVMFTCTLEFAEELSKNLFNNTALFYTWYIKATFTPGTEGLVWTLEPIDYRIIKGSLGFTKTKQDIIELSKIVKTLQCITRNA